MRSFKILLTLLIISLFPLNNAKGDDAKEDIIRKILTAYSRIESYQDTGYLEEKVTFNNKEKTIRIPFEIYFSRPNYLKVLWKAQLFPDSPHYECVLWSNGTETFTYWETGMFEKMESLKDGIHANTGVSHGITSTVPCLLTGTKSLSFNLEDITSILSFKEEKFNKTDCLYLKIKDKKEKIYELWIGKEDYLIRKLKRTLFTGIAEEVHQNIKINEKIDKETFNYKPKRNQ